MMKYLIEIIVARISWYASGLSDDGIASLEEVATSFYVK